MNDDPDPSAHQDSRAAIEELLRQLDEIRTEMIAGTPALNRRLKEVHPRYRASALNLLQYLALRRHDIRPIQIKLAALGLSSLGRAESHALATVDAVIRVLGRLSGRKPDAKGEAQSMIDFAEGRRLLDENTVALFGNPSRGRAVRIMVTMPAEAADDYVLVQNLLETGMDAMRINCAHDDAEVWLRMIRHLRRAEETIGRKCAVVMDLAGPKLRTGEIESGVAVRKIRPTRDSFGRVVMPARVWLTPAEDPAEPPSSADAVLPMPRKWLRELKVGTLVRFRDARGARRSLSVVDAVRGSCWAEASRTAYVSPGIVFRACKGKSDKVLSEAELADFAPAEGWILVQAGETLLVTRDQVPGRGATYDSNGRILTPASVGCTIPEVFDDVSPGEPIWFDDGKIGGVVERVETDRVFVRITQTRAGGARLRGDKGINLPESDLRLSALTDQDIADLEFAAKHADVVELSFANCADDVRLLQKHLARIGGNHPAIVLKIETRRGFDTLPEMLLTAMRSERCGVMIARGDLAVECGFERLAEVQEEILWVCEAAHVPVIWATQVLESLAKDGMPSRAEITDAAMGDRAECVMLNKGPHVLNAVRVLDHILRRMQAHQTKKRSMLRELRLAHVLEET